MLLASATLGGLVSGGGIAALGYRGLKDKLIGDLKDVFARRSEMREVKIAAEQAQHMALAAQDVGAQNAGAITEMRTADFHVGERLDQTLSRIERRLDEMERQRAQDRSLVDRTVATMDALEKRMDRHTKNAD